MATGGRGYHVVAPLDRSATFDDVRALARAVAARLAADAPDDLTTEQRIAKRGNRIYLDVARNAYAQTSVAPYSPRARPGAPVATPIDFAELGRVEPDGYGPKALLRRLARKSDPWADIAAHTGSASRACDVFRSDQRG
jgi:bifunctional non-homologous end joining protein LigD